MNWTEGLSRPYAILISVAAIALFGCGRPVVVEDAPNLEPVEAVLPASRHENFDLARQVAHAEGAMFAAIMPRMWDAPPQRDPVDGDFSLTVKGLAEVEPAMLDQLGQLYAETFTREELEMLLAFYDRPAGRAIVDKKIDIILQMSEIGSQYAPQVNSHLTQ